MKKVLIGICGIGNGHINRQACVINELINNNYQVLIATEGIKMDTVQNLFPGQKVIELSIPWIVCDEKGINFSSSLEKYNSNDLFKNFLEFGVEVEKNFKGKPDLIISDYEPNVAQYSYATQIPLITMEQQSKFLYLEEINLINHSIQEEISRLNYFFPRFDKKIVSSFFPTNIKDKKVIQVPPIISKLEKNTVINDFILVYLSPYSDSEKYTQVINIIKKIKNINFKVYSKNCNIYKDKYKFDNLVFSNFNKEFKKDLTKCSALITTGGHQLISEAISLDVPLYVMPLETYEQNYNAYMVNKYNLGTNADISEQSISKFISNREIYVKNIKEYKNKYYQKTWEELFSETIKTVIK